MIVDQIRIAQTPKDTYTINTQQIEGLETIYTIFNHFEKLFDHYKKNFLSYFL